MNLLTKILISLLFILEVLLLTTWKGIWGTQISSVVLIVASLLIGVFGMRISLWNQNIDLQTTKQYQIIKTVIALCVTAIFLTLIIKILNPLFAQIPLSKNDASGSDVIPLIMVMVERFLEGSFPYADVSIWGYTLRPTYMPMIWLPFTIAELGNFDYRWVPVGILTASLCFLQFYIFRRSKNLVLFTILCLAPWYLWYYLVDSDTYMFAITIENLNSGYYLIFCLCLLSRKAWLIGLGIALCLLARYSFILWVPFLGIIYLIYDYKKAITLISVSLMAVVFIYIIPFLSKDYHMFFDSLASYTVAAEAEWSRGLDTGQKPIHLFTGIGLAGLFYEYATGSVADKVKTLQLWHYLTSILSLVPLLLVYVKLKSKIILPVFLIASLKIYFAFFYNFIQVPYSYLMLVPMFISVLIVILAWTGSNTKQEAQ